MLSNNNYLYIKGVLRKNVNLLKFDLYKKHFNAVFLGRIFPCSSNHSDFQ